MLDQSSTNPVHIPAKAEKFEFDGEVAKIFPNMAQRSIPNYEAFHKLHAEIVARWFAQDDVSMLDVGASHGAFFTALNEFYANDPFREPAPRMRLTAIDNSPDMCRIMKQKLPNVEVYCMPAEAADLAVVTGQFDVINCTYVLQFIEPAYQKKVLRTLMGMVKPGGMLILGQKEKAPGTLGHMLQEQYIRWRISKGYSEEEIRAKSKALAGSMWPMDQDELRAELQGSFREVTETTRMFMFSTLIAFK